MSVRNRGSLKNPLVIAAVILALGGAGFLAYSHFAQNSKLEDNQAKLDKANQWRQNFSRKVVSPDRRFARVQLGVRPDESDKADHYIEIGGAVQTQADLDAFEAYLKQPEYTPPIRVEKTLKVEYIAPTQDQVEPTAPGSTPAATPPPAPAAPAGG